MIPSTIHQIRDLNTYLASIQDETVPKSKLLSLIQKQKKELTVRFMCMQSWYLRCSRIEKIKTLTMLMQELKTVESLSLILKTFADTGMKTTVYTECQYFQNFVYDKALHDHNRAFGDESLNETREADIEWFRSLAEDSEQILIIIGLIRLSGGCIIRQTFKRGLKLFEQRTADVIVEDCSRIEDSDRLNLRLKSSTELNPVVFKKIDLIPPLPSNDPFVVQMEECKKIWNDTINKYKAQVDKPTIQQSSKSAKTSKSGKSEIGKKDEEVDRIQLLPIWIVKMIFNYLDVKTLKKVKDVNKYWDYVVTDLQKEHKTRKFLDNFVRKQQESAPTCSGGLFENSTIKAPIKPKEFYGAKSKTRLRKLWERGAALRKLTGSFKNARAHRLFLDEPENVDNNYVLPLQKVEVFSRNISNYSPLYQMHSATVYANEFTVLHFADI